MCQLALSLPGHLSVLLVIPIAFSTEVAFCALSRCLCLFLMIAFAFVRGVVLFMVRFLFLLRVLVSRPRSRELHPATLSSRSPPRSHRTPRSHRRFVDLDLKLHPWTLSSTCEGTAREATRTRASASGPQGNPAFAHIGRGCLSHQDRWGKAPKQAQPSKHFHCGASHAPDVRTLPDGVFEHP